MATALLTAPSNAWADDDWEGVLVGLGVGVAMADVVFTVRDIIAVARDEHPGFGWGLAESIVNVPAAATLNAVTAVLAAGDDDEEGLFALAIASPASWTGTLAAHGLWAAIDSEAHPGALFGVSPILGVNASVTMIALGNTIAGRATPVGGAVLEMIGGAPGTILGSVELARGETRTGLWVGLTAWSGTIFAHGLVSAIVSGTEDLDEEPPVPEPFEQEPPPPLPLPVDQPLRQEPSTPERPAADMVQAAKLTVAPMLLIDVRGQDTPGITLFGIF